MMSLYELVQDETADQAARRTAAEALVRVGLLRRKRTRPSPMFIWLAGMTLVIVAAGAASTLGAWAVLVFVVGALVLYALRQAGRRGVEGLYVGPNGEAIRVPPAA